MDRLILAIESSCDDTSAAVLKGNRVLSNEVATQKIHEQYGGVVPELASREHQKNILPVVKVALEKAGAGISDLEAIAYTGGPGLMGSLLVGSSFAKSMSLALNIPSIAVHHMEAHILAHFIKDKSSQQIPTFPFLCLTVSGGHTQIVRVSGPGDMEILGETQDDAAGEAFDKIAKIMGLPYPGGPMIDKYASEGNPQAFPFPVARIDGYNFSFSGLKTNVLYFLQKECRNNPDFIRNHLNDLCASVQHTIVRTLMEKLTRAAMDTGINQVALAGGVSANTLLRQRLEETGAQEGWDVFIPAFEYCTDNAAMIGIAGQLRLNAGERSGLEVAPRARWSLA